MSIPTGEFLDQDLIIMANTDIRCASQVDAAHKFDDFESLQLIPRLVYGLLRGSLLLGSFVEPIGDDELVFREHLLTSLPPSQLKRAAYPSLSSYFSPDKEVCNMYEACTT